MQCVMCVRACICACRWCTCGSAGCSVYGNTDEVAAAAHGVGSLGCRARAVSNQMPHRVGV
ncbi:hypothetical protein E2C01_059022 [Portunus trituberculatus]|uniref:Secreted protein n=1 Tax=Portunus trituberculatus TaxID=210409 RepID=A0A5B7GY11_PORTR|nr:hypothetical protein [Portunus trituberculatus]